MAHLSLNGTSLYVEDTGGDRPPIVFSHGLLFSCRMWDAQVASLRSEYRCVAYDHRGQGRSDVPQERLVPIETCYDDAVALIERLGVGPVHFVGLSMGGFVGMRLAARRPDLVRTVTLLETSPDPEPAENVPRYRRLALVVKLLGARAVMGPVSKILFAHSWLEEPANAEQVAAWKTRLGANRRSIVKAVHGVIERASIADELGAIRTPVTIAVGDEDVATVPAKSERIHALIPGSRLEIIPRAGHSSCIERPDAVTRIIRESIARGAA
jgi:pimeloyl-ACP methyl ester carboxylesterase